MERKIKVAQIIGRVSEGGVEGMIANIFRHIDHSKVTFDFYVENTSIVVDEDEIKKYGGRVFIIPSYKHLFKFKKCLKKNFLNEKYDIVHANMNALSFIPLKIAKKCGIKIRIAHSHSTSNKKELLHHILKNIFRPYSKKYATHYFACSEKAGRWLYGDDIYNEGKVEIINNAIDLKKFEYNEAIRSKMRNDLNLPHDAFVIGHVGRFSPQKNHRFLIDVYSKVFKSNKNAYLLLIGSGEFLSEIKELVQEKKLPNVIFTGPVPNVCDYYQAMDCFVLPSLYEGLPVVGVEAQANSLKCFFSSEVTKEAKLLNDTEFIDLSIGSDKWAEKILSFIGKYKDRTINRIPNEFNIDNVSAKVLSLYQKYMSLNN